VPGEARARELAQEWIEAWNAHDLDAILSHYGEDVVFSSPFVVKLTGDPSGTLCGKPALRDYFGRGLAAYPDLRFELLRVLNGVDSVTLYYRSVNGLYAAETMQVGEDGLVCRVWAHYGAGD